MAAKKASEDTSAGDKRIEIQAPDRRIVRVTIRGLTPLLTNKISEYAVRKILKEKIAKDKEPTPEQIFEAAIYRDELGEACFPGGGIRRAMIDAGRSSGHAMTVLRQVFNVDQELIPILESEPQLRIDMVRNNNAGGALCIAYRPQFRRPWSMVVPLRYNAGMIHLNDLLALMNLAGCAVGIGCWRPDKYGIFGQFEVESVKEGR